ncbi:MAG: hypothetical protein QW667_03930 [Candidatus Bathyarchaeia archaeon]
MKIDKTELVAFILIAIGAALLVLTFYMAFTQLTTELGILPAPDLSQALGEILGPIAEALIKVMYLSIMGWTGSIATIRGIQLIREIRQAPQPKLLPPQQPPQPQQPQQPQQTAGA